MHTFISIVAAVGSVAALGSLLFASGWAAWNVVHHHHKGNPHAGVR